MTAPANAGAPAGGTVRHAGPTVTRPSSCDAGRPDNTVASGQCIALTGNGSVLGFLVTATYGTASGTATVHYADGSTQSFTLTVPTGSAVQVTSRSAPDTRTASRPDP